MPKESNVNELELKNRSYIKSVDGLRAISILFVMLYHLMPHVFAGGYLGVLVFFVLSGYFITDNLLCDFDKGGKFNLFEFYKSRFSKLYTTYLPFLCIVSFVILGFFHEALINFSQNVVSAVFGFNNIYQIVNGLSYFETHGVLNPFTHLWFMGVELQFYLFYPILLRVFYRASRGKKADIFVLLFLTSLVSAGLMYVNYSPETDISRIYYGTDTRLFSLLVGGFFACAFPKSALRTLRVKKWQGVFYTLFSLVFLTAIIWSMFMLDAQIAWLYPLGMYAFSMLAGVFLILIMIRGNLIANLLSIEYLTYFGSRSFSLYLWQYAIMVFVNAQFLWIAIDPILLLAINLIITAIIAEISYQLFEKKKVEKRKCSNKVVLVSFSLLTMVALALPQYYPDYFVARDDLSDLKRVIKEAQGDELNLMDGEEPKDMLVADLGSGVNDATNLKNQSSKTASHAEAREHDELNYEEVHLNEMHQNDKNQNVGNPNPGNQNGRDETSGRGDERNLKNQRNNYDSDAAQDQGRTQDQLSSEEINKLISESKNSDDAMKKMFEQKDGSRKQAEGDANADASMSTMQGGRSELQDSQQSQGQNDAQNVQHPQNQTANTQAESQQDAQTTAEAEVEEESQNQEAQSVSAPFTFIGDSVMLGSKPNIQKVFTNSVVNAKVSRQAHHLYDILHDMDNRGELYDNIVIHLGTNGRVDKDMLIRAIQSVGNRRVYLINAVVPRSWEGQVNQVIEEVANELPNVSVIDWYGYAKGKRELFYKDATHPELIGREKYTELIRKSID